MKKPLHQQLLVWLIPIGISITCGNTILSAISNSQSLSFEVASYLILLILITWIAIELALRLQRLKWITRQGQEIVLKSIGIGPRLGLVAWLLFLSGPQIYNLWNLRPEEIEMVRFSYEHERQSINIPTSQNTNNNTELSELETLLQKKQPTDNVSKLKIESTTCQILKDDASIIVYTFGYGALADKNVKVYVNDHEVSRYLAMQNDYQNASILSLMGNNTQLNLHTGLNKISLKIGGFTTEPHFFKAFKIPI